METIKYLAATAVDWRLPEELTPPHGQMIQLLSVHGKAAYGMWENNCYWVAWAPFPKIPPHIKQKMLDQEKVWRKA